MAIEWYKEEEDTRAYNTSILIVLSHNDRGVRALIYTATSTNKYFWAHFHFIALPLADWIRGTGSSSGINHAHKRQSGFEDKLPELHSTPLLEIAPALILTDFQYLHDMFSQQVKLNPLALDLYKVTWTHS